jgi:hypothetical protein
VLRIVVDLVGVDRLVDREHVQHGPALDQDGPLVPDLVVGHDASPQRD